MNSILRSIVLVAGILALVAQEADAGWSHSEKRMVKQLNKQLKLDAKEPIDPERAFSINLAFREAGVDFKIPNDRSFKFDKPARVVDLSFPTIPTHFVNNPDHVTIQTIAVVGPDGRVVEVYVTDSTDSRYDESVIKAIRDWEFISPELDGSPSCFTVESSFSYSYL